MAMSSDQTGIRKGVLFVASATAVYAISNTNDVSWIIKLDGWKAWAFLVAGNLYFACMWYIHRNIIEPDTGQKHRRFFYKDEIVDTKKTDYGVDRYAGRVDGDVARQFMARSFTDFLSFIGVCGSLMGFVLPLNRKFF